MSDFMAKMQQIRFPLGLCPIPRSVRVGAYSVPQTPELHVIDLVLRDKQYIPSKEL